MSELLSALNVALDMELPALLASGETTVDQFLIEQGFSLQDIKDELHLLSSDRALVDGELLQLCASHQTLFSNSKACSEFASLLVANQQTVNPESLAGGIGHSFPVAQHSKLNHDISLHEQAEAQALQDVSKLSMAPGESLSGREWIQEATTHTEAVKDYSKAYTYARKHTLGRVSWSTARGDLVKDVLRYQTKTIVSNFAQGYKTAATGNKRYDWTSGPATVQQYNGQATISWGYGYKDGSESISVTHVDGGRKEANQTGTATWSVLYSNDNTDNQISETATLKDGTLTVSDNNYNEKKHYTQVDITKSYSITQAKAYKRDKAIVERHQNADLLPQDVKDRFGRLIEVSAVLYSLKRDAAIEKKYWPDDFSKMVAVATSGDPGKITKSVYRFSQRNVYAPIMTHNQKREAKLLRAYYGEVVAVNQSEKYALTNSYRVYERAISEGMSKITAEKIADLTYFSDLVIFDSFIASSYLATAASNKLNGLLGVKALNEMTYALMPYVIRRQVHDTRHILNLERTAVHFPKLATDLLRFDLFKNRCLTKVLRYGDTEYSKYLGFHPIHRTLRATKHVTKIVTKGLEKYIIDPVLSATVSAFTFGYFHGKYLTKAVNGAVSVVEGAVFAMVKGLVHLPKHLYKDTKKLSEQFSRILTGQATWKGSWDALGRDTRGVRRLGQVVWVNAAAFSSIPGYKKKAYKEDKNIGKTFYAGIDAAFHKGAMALDMDIMKIETHLHSSVHRLLHKSYPNLVKSPYQLLKEHYTTAVTAAQERVVGALKKLLASDVAGLKDGTYSLSTYKGRTAALTSRKINKALQTQINNKVKSLGLNQILTHYLFNNSLEVKSTFKAISQRQRERLERQIKAFKLIDSNKQAFLLGLKGAAIYERVQKAKHEIDKSVTKQIKKDWKHGGQTEFSRIFVNPYLMTLPLKKNRSASAQAEISGISSFTHSKKPGEHLFAAILIGDYVHKIITSSEFRADATRVNAAIQSNAYAAMAYRLIKWDTRKATARISFILSIGSIQVNTKSLKRLRSGGLRKIYPGLPEKMSTLVADHHTLALDDLKWYKYNHKHGSFMKQFRNDVTRLAKKDNQVALAWQKDVNTIKHGGSMSVGQIFNSLEPTKDHWGLQLTRPSPSKNKMPSLTKDGEAVSSAAATSSLITVSIMGTIGRYKAANRFYNKLTGKKKDGDKDKPDGEKSDLDETVSEDVQLEETDLIGGLDADVDVAVGETEDAVTEEIAADEGAADALMM